MRTHAFALLALTGLLPCSGLAQELAPRTEPSTEQLVEHYKRAEAELRAADTSHLNGMQQARRAQALDWLRQYREAGRFGRNTYSADQRTLAFVDEDGRRCAVAWLLDAAGEQELVLDIARADNHAFIAELGGSEPLTLWLKSHGLSLEDAARIQAPTGGGPGDTVPPPAGGTWSGPGDTVPQPVPGGGGPAAPGPSGPSSPGPGAGGPSTPGPSGPTARPRSPIGPTTASTGPGGYHVGPEVWMTWWELHRMDYLTPNLLRNWLGSVTQWTDDGIDHLETVRQAVLPHLRGAMGEDDPVLRASATIALARLQGEQSVEDILPMLDDSTQFVRERAILALGATGSMKAAEVLLDIFEDGAVGAKSRVSPDARSLAVIALAIGRQNGMNGYVDMAVVAQLPKLDGADRHVVQGCALLYQSLNPNPALSDWCLARATDETVAPGVRCRALETLRTRDDDEALAVLLHALGSRRLDERRSAALALGEFPNPLALQPLLTAAETEGEPLTRAFVLLSIGRRGGAEATAFLRNFLEEGPKTLRAWAAIGLGIAAREDPTDDRSREALRASLKREKNREAKGAYYLALGIAKDMESLRALDHALVDGSSYEIRSAAAMGLGMLEDEKATDALRARLEKDHCEYTRAAIAEAIGFVGDHTDNTRLAESYQSMKVFENQSVTALALGLHGQRSSVEELIHVVQDEERSTLERAAAIDALQVVLGKKPSLTLARLLRQSNFLVFPPPLIAIREILL